VKNLLVTGRHGFVGNTLARMVESEPAFSDWTLAEVPPSFQILDPASTRELVARAAPDAVIHLAAQSNVPVAFSDPERTLRINVLGTLNLLQALKQAGFRGRMVYAGTGDVYGAVAEDALPVDETLLPRPRNPYAVSKLAGEALCRQWCFTEGMQVALARPFNHIGPGQSEEFVVSGLSKQVAAIRGGRQAAELAVGDIDVTRDFSDVRDVVRAYFALLAAGTPGEVYNICSGEERSVRSILEKLMQIAGVEIAIKVDQTRLRPAEQRRMCGSTQKMLSATGWRTTIPIEQSVADTLNFWEREGAVHA
jgi:GDP-4-dehydro-6-deoxy-D-mannose reductase